jgi:hypothetical protein
MHDECLHLELLGNYIMQPDPKEILRTILDSDLDTYTKHPDGSLFSI